MSEPLGWSVTNYFVSNFCLPGENNHRKGRLLDKSHRPQGMKGSRDRSVSPVGHQEAPHRNMSNSNRHRKTERCVSSDERQKEGRSGHDRRASPDCHRSKDRKEGRAYSPHGGKRKSERDTREGSQSDSERGGRYSEKHRRRQERDSRSCSLESNDSSSRRDRRRRDK